MSDLTTWQSALTASWTQVWLTVLNIVPTVLGAVAIFILGMVLAYWMKHLVVKVLDTLRFDKLTQSAGINEYLKKADINMSLTHLLGLAVEWIVILVFFLAVVDVLGLTAVSKVLTQVISFIPNILAAALILAAGYIVAGFTDGIVRGSLSGIDPDIAKPVGRLSRWMIILITVFAAIDQLQIAKGLIQTFFQGLTYTLVLVVGLSVGLGSKDLVAKVLDDWYKKIK